MQFAGIKELKDKLTYYIGLTKHGDSVIVTDRGMPVAILHNLDTIEEKAGTEERLASLSKRGMLRLPLKSGMLIPIKPLKTKGRPASEIIIEEKR